MQTLLQDVTNWLNKHSIVRKYLIRIGVGIGICMFRNMFWMSYYKYYRYPPYVSLGLPLLGCMPSFVVNPETFMSSTVCKEGKLPISTIPLGPKSIIFVNDIKAAKVLLKNKSIGINRPLFIHPFANPMHFAFINGNEWLKRRKFIKITFGSITKSSFICKTIKELFKRDLYPNYIDKAILENNGEIYISTYSNFIAFYAIIAAMFGDKLEDIKTINNTFYKEYMKMHHINVAKFAPYLIYETFVGLKIPQKIFWSLFSAKKWDERALEILENYLLKHNILKCDDDKALRWNKLNKNKSLMVNKMIDNDEGITVKEMIADLYALLTAGIETTAKQIQFGLVMLCKYPDIQSRIFNELSKFTEYKPSLVHKELHFLKAFVYEILRFGVVSPIGLPHKCYNDVEVNGYKIYK